jgi:hypothetical protein
MMMMMMHSSSITFLLPLFLVVFQFAAIMGMPQQLKRVSFFDGMRGIIRGYLKTIERIFFEGSSIDAIGANNCNFPTFFRSALAVI